MKQRRGLAIVLFCLMPALFAQQKAKQNAREDNASFMFTESQLNEDDDAAQSTSALVTSNNDVYLSNVGYLFSPMRFRVRGYDSQYSDMYINGVQFNFCVVMFGLINVNILYYSFSTLYQMCNLRQSL